MFNKIGFIGCGNMGSAIAKAVCENGYGKKVCLADPDKDKTKDFVEKYGCKSSTNKKIAAECDLIFLAVKPQVMADMLKSIAPDLKKRTDRFVLVSMAAGLSMDTILKMASGKYPIIRIMPNTPVSIGQGMILMCNKGTAEEETDSFRKLLAKGGIIDEIPEDKIDAASAVSGCGPAFVAMMIESIADGGVACGLPRDKALLYAAQTIQGVGSMYIQSKEHPEVMKDKVCSPGGTTIQGVRALENRKFRSACMEAVIASYNKTIELKG
jgi:pyrroline-5-carboxylate reductase